jgi:hypothetical protein
MIAEVKPFSWAAKPESLEAKFKLMCRLPYDARARRRHVLVFGFILDWYHSKYGDALASVRHVHRMVQERDPAGKGLYIGEIHGALTDLVAWGYLEQEKGKGRRASRYVPNWAALELSVQEIPNANDNDRSVLESPNTSVLESPNANGRSVRDSLNEDPSTLTRVIDPGTGMDEVDCAAPSAPPVAGLAAATAGTAQESGSIPADPSKWFDRLYVVYGVKKDKANARRQFEKIAPDLSTFADMIEAARKWRTAAGGIERKHLATWLRDECYDEEPSGVREQRKTKHSSTKAAGDKTAVRRMKIITAENFGNPFGDYFLKVEFEGENEIISREWHLYSKDGSEIDLDLRNALIRAVGSDDLVGRFVGVRRLRGNDLEFFDIGQPEESRTTHSPSPGTPDGWPDWMDDDAA